MSPTVLSIAYPFAPVGPKGVGGAEQILSDLDRGLVAAGHRSLVVACEGSQCAGTLFPVAGPGHAVLDEVRQESCRQEFQRAIDRALASETVDLVHMHGIDFHRFSIPEVIPVLVTLHLPISWYPRNIWGTVERRMQFCCVSHSQKRTCPAEIRDCLVVENGVELPPYDPDQSRDDFAVVLGRICPEKNAHAALEAGNLSGTRVVLAGRVFPYREHMEYFARWVAPLLQGRGEVPRHEFVGAVDSARRQELLGRAKCLLHPTLAAETSSLVAMEALATGTPIISYGSGALSEIVEDGVTGFVVGSVEEMAQAMRKIHTLSSQACRRRAEQSFNRERMVQQYLDVYRKISSQKMELSYV